MPLKKDVFFVFTSLSPCTSWIFTKGSENWMQNHSVGDQETQSIHPSIHPPIHLSIQLPIHLTAQPLTHPFVSHQSIHSRFPLLLSFIHFPIYPSIIYSSFFPSSCLSAHPFLSYSSHPKFTELLPCVRHCVHFTDAETEDSRQEMICLRSG